MRNSIHFSVGMSVKEMQSDPHARLVELSQSWRVELRRIEQTPSSVIGFGERSNEPVVLKVATRPHDEWNAGQVVSAFRGHGMVRALEHTPGAVLLECLKPGTPLVDLVGRKGESKADRVLVQVIDEMSEFAPKTEGYSRAEDWCAGFDKYLAAGGNAVPAKLVVEARGVLVELGRTQRDVRLLHGDLQHYNVLWSETRGWKAIDPKGVVAEVAVELGAVLRNPAGMLDLYTKSGIKRRVRRLSEALALDLVRVAGWAFVLAVLSAVWMIEDEGVEAPIEHALRVAKNARLLVP